MYDVFEKRPDGTRIWVCVVASLQEAVEKITPLKLEYPSGNFEVHDLEVGAVVYSSDGNPSA